MKWSSVFLLLSVAAASSRGTPAEAQAMLAKAVAHYNQAGRDQALKDFTAGKAPFRDRDLYVACVSYDGFNSANGGFPQYVGQPSNLLRDADGKPLADAIIKSAAKGHGSVKYHWMNPVNHKTELKTLFTEKLAKDVCGVGVYTAE